MDGLDFYDVLLSYKVFGFYKLPVSVKLFCTVLCPQNLAQCLAHSILINIVRRIDTFFYIQLTKFRGQIV